MESPEIRMKPIGVIRSPYREVSDSVPIQGALRPEVEGVVKIFPEYREGLNDLKGFSHVFIIYIFHKSATVKLRPKPYMDRERRGVFATRSPHRPNHLGMTLVRVLELRDDSMRIAGIDVVDGTPLLDIKPYVPAFDSARDVSTGWMRQYLEGERAPESGETRSREEWLHEP